MAVMAQKHATGDGFAHGLALREAGREAHRWVVARVAGVAGNNIGDELCGSRSMGLAMPSLWGEMMRSSKRIGAK